MLFYVAVNSQTVTAECTHGIPLFIYVCIYTALDFIQKCMLKAQQKGNVSAQDINTFAPKMV